MYRLSVQLMFSAAHYLREYAGDCAKLHGHNWKVKIDVTANGLNDAGMALDFKNLKDLSWQVLERLDHQLLNEVEPFDKLNPTAENLAQYIYREIKPKLPPAVHMEKIGLWETDKYLVEYSE